MAEVFVGVASLVVGFFSGLATPWVKWLIEKQRDRFAYRRELVRTWRSAIEGEVHDFIDERCTLGSSAAYSSLRSHMTSAAVEKVEAPQTMYVGGGRGDEVRKHVLLDEIARIEKAWDLV